MVGLALLASSALAEAINVRAHGNCLVFESRDPFEDSYRGFMLDCSSRSSAGRTEIRMQISINTKSREYSFGFESPRSRYSSGSTAFVKFRFDDGAVFDRRFQSYPSSRWAFRTFAPAQISEILTELAESNSLAVEVNAERSRIDLTGSASAVRDFSERVSLHFSPEYWLELDL